MPPYTAPARRRAVLILEPSPVLREGLRSVVDRQPDLRAVEPLEAPAAALRRLGACPADAVLLGLPVERDAASWRTLRLLRRRRPGLPVVVFSRHADPTWAEPALRAGARGFVSADASCADLVESVRLALAGRIGVGATLGRRLLAGAAPAATQPRSIGRLSGRELEVFSAIALGRSRREIARELSMSVRTVEAHRANIKRKLGLSTGGELLRRAILWSERRSAERG